MQDEQSWITTQTVGEDENVAATNYQYFMSKEPRENLGPISEIDDPYLGKTKVREVYVGMTRNAKEENKKAMLAYLSPYPHVRIDKAKPLQGWYKSLHEPKGVRPRPCFTEAILTEPYGGWCLPGDTLVATTLGPKRIDQISPDDKVIGVKNGSLVISEIFGWICSGEKEILELDLGDLGSIRTSGDHPIYSLDREDYVRAEELNLGERIDCFEAGSLSRLWDNFRNRLQRESFEILPKPQIQFFHTKETTSFGSSGEDSGHNLDMSRLRQDYKNNTLRGLSRTSPNSSREDEKRGDYSSSSRNPQIYGDPGETKESTNREKAFSDHQEVMCGIGTKRDNRIQEVSQGQIPMPPGEVFSIPFSLGTVGSRIFGRPKTGLGIRTNPDLAQERRPLLAGFSNQGRNDHRGKGVYNQEGYLQNSTGERVGVSPRSLEREEVETVRTVGRVLSKKTRGIEKVYDIETSTNNFLGISSNGFGVNLHNCAVGCAFCYVNSGFRGYRGSGLITVPLDYAEQIREQLSKMRRGAAGYFTSFTDPFLPLEEYYHNTEYAAREFVKVNLPIFFLSRLRYPGWAIDLLKENPHSYAQKSINTPDPKDWHYLSPGAISLEEHLEDISRLKRHGIYVSIQCNPIVPGITSHKQVVDLFKLLKKAGADHVIVKFVEAGYSWAPAMVERMIKRFGDRGEKFKELFTENIGGQRTIQEKYRMTGHRLYSQAAKKLGLTYATCYEYRYARDKSGNIKDKTGVSVGREYTTASQCHGHTVPVYSRETTEDLFQPVEECPPSGCLYCAEENGGEPRCGDELAGEANALRLVDFKSPIGEGKGRRTIELPLV